MVGWPIRNLVNEVGNSGSSILVKQPNLSDSSRGNLIEVNCRKASTPRLSSAVSKEICVKVDDEAEQRERRGRVIPPCKTQISENQ